MIYVPGKEGKKKLLLLLLLQLMVMVIVEALLGKGGRKPAACKWRERNLKQPV